MAGDIVQHQRIASGYVHAASDPTLATVFLQNCTVTRTPNVVAGSFDIHLNDQGAEPAGLGGVQVGLNVIVSQGRARFGVRGPASSRVNQIFYGDEQPGPLRNPLLVRVTIINGAGALADANFDFDIERVIDPAVET